MRNFPLTGASGHDAVYATTAPEGAPDRALSDDARALVREREAQQAAARTDGRLNGQDARERVRS